MRRKHITSLLHWAYKFMPLLNYLNVYQQQFFREKYLNLGQQLFTCALRLFGG